MCLPARLEFEIQLLAVLELSAQNMEHADRLGALLARSEVVR